MEWLLLPASIAFGFLWGCVNVLSDRVLALERKVRELSGEPAWSRLSVPPFPTPKPERRKCEKHTA
jgi:hypothetical protein